MDHLIEIAFKGNRKEFFLWEGDAPPPLQAAVIVDADRGEDLGRVHSTGELALKRAAGVPHKPGEEGAQRRARRLATGEDVQRHDELRSQDEIARRRPDYVFILPWNFRDEIMSQMAGIREWGGQFIVPIPEARIVP